ncbi:MAG TPA: TonB-dependent receptor [Flavipsychrobacter sp.]|nr:TonB-dependent receptor [Flavipsychrobacter sp.]
MLRLFVSYLILFIAIPLFSLATPNELTGTVTDTHGQPLIGAIVQISDLKTGAATDLKGHYKINNLPKGKFLVEVSLLSYTTVTQAIEINGVTRQDFQLNESVIERNEVVVTGTSLATEERKSITPIQSIGIKEMQENASTNVIDAISKLPGVNELTTGPAVSKPFIRGLGYNRIITLNDGVRQEGQQWGDEHGIEIDDYNVSRIEVLKGPASLAYGSDALAGVVNVISDEPLPEGKIQGNISSNYQTNDGLAALHAQLGGNVNGLSWNAYATQKNAHDYQNKYDGYVYDTRFSNTNYGLSAGINKKWGFTRLSYSSFNEKLGIPEGNRDTATGNFLKDVNVSGTSVQEIVAPSDGRSYDMVTPYQHINHQKLVWNSELYLNNGNRLAMILGYQQNDRMEFNDPVLFNTPGLSLLLHTYTYDFKYFLHEWKGWGITTGINGMEQINQNRGSEFLIPDYNLFDIGAYGIAKKQWGAWTLAGGLRYDFRTMSTQAKYVNDVTGGAGNVMELFNPFTRNFSNVSGSIGTSYDINKRTTIKFNLASGYRNPNIAELSANGVHDGTVRYEYGNVNLKAENSIQGDAGISWNTKHVMVDASVFNNYIRDFIFIHKLLNVNGTDSIPTQNNAENYPAFKYGQSDANLYGAELYVDLHPHPLDWLHFENTLSYVRGKFVNPTSDSTTNIPFIPPFRWLIDLKAEKRSLGKHLKNAYVKVGLDINSAQNNVFSAYGTETTTPGYTLLDAGIGADFTNKKQQTIFTLTLAGQNLTDVAYQSNLSRLKYTPENDVTGRMGIFNMGRNFSITLAIPLDFK